MTAAQALIPGSAGPTSANRPSNGASAKERDGGASFREALDGGSKGAPEAATGSRGREQTNPDQPSPETEAQSATTAQDGRAPPEPAQQPSRVVLSETPQDTAESGTGDALDSFVRRLQAMLGKADPAAAQNGMPDDPGPWLPGLVDEDGEAFDAARLLAIMRSQGAQGASMAGGATVVTVLGQERHLALGRLPADLAVQLSNDPEIAALMRGDSKTIADAAALSAQIDSGPDGIERARGKAGGEDLRLAAEIGGGRRGALFASEGRGQSGPGLGEHGQDGRQQEGRSSGNGGQSASNAFHTAMQSPALQAAGAARGASFGAPGQHDSVGDQIAARIRADLTADGVGETSSDGVVKVLNLELKPANLGAVTLRMTLKDNVLTLHVETANAETRALVEREQAKLTSALSSAGYTVDSISAVQSDGVRAGPPAVSADPNSGSFQQPGGQSQGQQPSSQFSGEGRSGRSSPGGQEPSGASGGKDDGGAAINRGVDGVYV